MKKKLYQIKSKAVKKLKVLMNDLLKRNRGYNKRVFTEIYEKDLFNARINNENNVSRSGSGSDLEQTREIIAKLPAMLKKYGIGSILDVPCGDFYWMRYIDLAGIDYTGGDIVSQIVANNNATYGAANIRFVELDVVNDRLPKVDLVICRDLLVHLKNDQVNAALANIKRSGATYLLTTSFKNTTENVENQIIGFWRPINLELEPFGMNAPIDEIFENCTEANGRYNDKHLLLYKLNDAAS